MMLSSARTCAQSAKALLPLLNQLRSMFARCVFLPGRCALTVGQSIASTGIPCHPCRGAKDLPMSPTEHDCSGLSFWLRGNGREDLVADADAVIAGSPNGDTVYRLGSAPA